eukprot:11298357-Alexandrium_andersonii.AAC.1
MQGSRRCGGLLSVVERRPSSMQLSARSAAARMSWFGGFSKFAIMPTPQASFSPTTFSAG